MYPPSIIDKDIFNFLSILIITSIWRAIAQCYTSITESIGKMRSKTPDQLENENGFHFLSNPIFKNPVYADQTNQM